MATQLPNTRAPSQTEKWTAIHRDTGYTLRYIHEATQAGITPTRDDWKKNEAAKPLITYHGHYKVNHNWKTTVKRYKKFLVDGRGDFTQEQLTIAGISTPEGNAGRIGGLGIDPGSEQ